MLLMGYVEWRKFEGAIQRAKVACVGAGQTQEDHFVGADKMIKWDALVRPSRSTSTKQESV